MLLLLPAWVTLSFLASNLILVIVFSLLSLFDVSIETLARPTVLQMVTATSVYVLTLGIAIGAPLLMPRILGLQTSRKFMGLTGLPTWTDIGLAPVAFIAYGLIITGVLTAVTSLFPGFPLDQAQDVGFEAFGSRLDNILAFVTLVVLAPIAEEVLFRGYLYGKLKAHIPTIIAAVATSLLFALAHMQLNVGVDVFILSLILCGLRSLTGSIWAGVLVHMIKNAIAYYLLFIAPLVGM
jgi:uncharacterized protein